MNQRLKLYCLCVLLILILLGCSVSTKITMIDGKRKPLPPISSTDVKIFTSIDKVLSEYEEIGLITSEGDYQQTDLTEMYESMREEAAKVGANGIVLGIFEEPPTHRKVLNHFFPVSLVRRGKATAIYVFPVKE